MKRSINLILAAVFLVLFCVSPAWGIIGVPKMVSVSPDTAKVGDTVVVVGEYLDKSRVAEVYLTDGKNDFKVKVTEQSEQEIKFIVPKEVKPGRYSLMVLTSGQPGMLIEEPVKLNVEQ